MGLAILLSACSAQEDGTAEPFGGAPRGTVSDPLARALPEPKVRRVDPPTLNPEQRMRQDEVDRYLVKRYHDQQWRIVETTQTYIGDIIVWVDPASVPGSQVEPPPRPSPEEMQLPPGVELQMTELDLYPELRGPEGTIPFIRPTFAAYVRGDSGASSVEDFIRGQVPGQPVGQNRLYAGFAKIAANKEVNTWVNPFGGTIETNTLSLLEMIVICRGADPTWDMEMVGIAASRDTKNFGDSIPRVQVEFLTAGDTVGPNIGGWDGKVAGFVAAAGRPYGPGFPLSLLSTNNGTQYESRFNIQLSGGNWWVGHNGNWLGYYPGSLFNLINLSACEADWYGEVWDSTPTDWTWTDMGSGQFASTGYGHASNFRNPYYVDPLGASHWPDNASNVSPIDNACYTRSNLLTAATPWDRAFYLGGPGGDAVGCN